MCTPEWANLLQRGARRAGGARSANTRNGRTPTGDCNGISRRLIAERFKVSADAAWRHGREHLTAEIRAALATKVLAREGDMYRILLKEGSGVVEALKAIRGPLFDMFLVAIDLRQARVCDAGDRCPVSILLSRSEEYCERQVWGKGRHCYRWKRTAALGSSAVTQAR